ncbi:hypothetical protein B0T21DRAFT_414886 [Apiosordaria backusii]|uniref:Uncharacterized protein n=1 Tax=Apiosordaria backusii TaxID=314023 RepID=A0AA40AN33_9PEZI|nr:hypothetical protein B0T21DRAFT_414886 [Apiosordaria backusii]
MNNFPCANYYNRPNPTRCTNYVSKFGERCKLCLTVKDGHSLTQGLLLEHELVWVDPESKGGDKKSGSSSVGGYISSWFGGGR